MTLTALETTLLLAVFAFVFIVIGLLEPAPVVAFWRRIVAWAREEGRLAREESWAHGVYHGPGTVGDPRVAAMAEKQRELAARMREEGRHLLDSPTGERKPYKPIGTKPVEPPPPRAAAVVPIRRAAGGKR